MSGSSTRRRASPTTGDDAASGRSRPSRTTRKRSALRLTLTRRQKWAAVTVVVLLVVLTAVAWFTPALSVRDVQVRGVSALTQDQVRTALDVPMGTPLLKVDLTAAAARVAALGRVARATVDRQYPSELVVSVQERIPVVFVDKPGGTHLLDSTGVDFATEPPPPGVPRLVAPDPAPADPLTTAALQVIAALPSSVRVQVVQITPGSPVDVRFTLLDGRTVAWGAPADMVRKGEVLAALLTQPGKIYDVSSPDLPTVG